MAIGLYIQSIERSNIYFAIRVFTFTIFIIEYYVSAVITNVCFFYIVYILIFKTNNFFYSFIESSISIDLVFLIFSPMRIS